MSSGSFDLLPDRPFVLVARVGRLDQIGAGADLQHQVDEVLELEVVHARRDVDAVAGVEADAVFRNAAQRVVQRLDAQRDELAAVLDRGVERAVVVRRHARIVDLQQEAGVDDRHVFLAHRVGERREILLVGGVVAVLVVELEVGRRDRGDEGFFGVDALRATP